MPPRYEVLFLFTAPQGHLVEIKRLDRPDIAPKDQLFHWLWVDATTVMTLHFLGMNTSPRQRRRFEEAHLEFDTHRAGLRWIGGSVILPPVGAHRATPDDSDPAPVQKLNDSSPSQRSSRMKATWSSTVIAQSDEIVEGEGNA